MFLDGWICQINNLRTNAVLIYTGYSAMLSKVSAEEFLTNYFMRKKWQSVAGEVTFLQTLQIRWARAPGDWGPDKPDCHTLESCKCIARRRWRPRAWSLSVLDAHLYPPETSSVCPWRKSWMISQCHSIIFIFCGWSEKNTPFSSEIWPCCIQFSLHDFTVYSERF